MTDNRIAPDDEARRRKIIEDACDKAFSGPREPPPMVPGAEERVERAFRQAMRNIGLGKDGVPFHPCYKDELNIAFRDGWNAAQARIAEIIARLESPHADKIFVAKDYTKADLIADLRALSLRPDSAPTMCTQTKSAGRV